MRIGEIKHKAQDIEKSLASLYSADPENLLHENYDDGFTVTWRFVNCPTPQTVVFRIEAVAIQI